MSRSRAIVGAIFACAALSCSSSSPVPTLFEMDQRPGTAVAAGTGGAAVAVNANGGAPVPPPTGASSAPPMDVAPTPMASASGGAAGSPAAPAMAGTSGSARCDASASCGGGGLGSGGAIDAGAPPLPTADSVFHDAPPFVAHTGPRTHNAGKDCMTCHRTGGDEAPRFSFGGTVYDPMGNPVVGAEVRIVGTSGKATSVYTSSTGTFYSQSTGLDVPSRVGVRDGTYESDMLPALLAPSDGACTSCHCTAASCMAAPVHLP